MTQIFDSIFYNVVENFENICTNKQNLETKEANSDDISVCLGANVEKLPDGGIGEWLFYFCTMLRVL